MSENENGPKEESIKSDDERIWDFISNAIGIPNGSRVGRAILSKK